MAERDLLLNYLKDLDENEFKDFKWYLMHEKVDDTPPIQKSQLSEAKRRDVVDLMVQTYGFDRAVKVMKIILKKMNRNDLVTKLSKDQGKVFSREEHPTVSQTSSPERPTMTAVDTMTRNKTKIVDALSGDHSLILNKVQEKGLLTQREYGNLKDITGKNREEIITHLVDKIMEKGENTCHGFLNLLRTDPDIRSTYLKL